MARGPRKHQHRLSAPSHWMLDKLQGSYAPKASPGPHKLRDCLPLIVFLRNRLKYAITGKEVTMILMQRLIKVDGKVRTDSTYPAGFMDVISIDKTGEHFRLVYDVKGRFAIHRIEQAEAEYKLGKVKRVQVGRGGIPFLVTHDARTIRYPDPAIKVNDTVKIDLSTGKITDFIRFDTGVVAMVIGGRNMGRVGVITHRERHDGGFNIVHVKDAIDNSFATRESNIFIIGKEKPWISLPKGKGVKGPPSLLTPTDFYNAQDPTYTPTTLSLTKPMVPTAAALLTAQTANAYAVFALLALAFSWTTHARSVKIYLLCVGFGDIGHMLATYKVLGGDVVFDPLGKWTVMVWGHLGIGMALNVVRWGTLVGVFGPLEAGGATERKVKRR
ncbi:40S ribosomal protein S4 [Cyphellophora attinorum]|uniref:40S ribosomal protein S4 n=1 Tax=Cyphellophora attinorum TaxID=1664694 RepID=A0A0N1P2T3_9EURO|nr:40S ribosomal protein S4 [Phialophora attinorum]KPI44015.1 40S ribosomal protein S4 [Phialophora attinorum]